MKSEIMKNLILALPLLATVTSGRILYARHYLATRQGGTLNTIQGNVAAELLEANGASFQSLGATQQEACDAKFNQCADAANAGESDASADECQQQKGMSKPPDPKI